MLVLWIWLLDFTQIVRHSRGMRFLKPTLKKVLMSFFLGSISAYFFLFSSPMPNCGRTLCNIPDSKYFFFITDTGIGVDVLLLGKFLILCVLSYITLCAITFILYKKKNKKNNSKSITGIKL